MNRYEEWIVNYKGDIYRKCKEVSIEMQQVFPELRIAKGLVTIMENGKDYQHQWLLDEENNIVDPTRRQWLGIEEFELPLPKGRGFLFQRQLLGLRSQVLHYLHKRLFPWFPRYFLLKQIQHCSLN